MGRIDQVKYLREIFKSMPEDEFEDLSLGVINENAWFTAESVRESINGVVYMLADDKLDKWLSQYSFNSQDKKTVGLVMAGNIPMVGFHDLLCVYLSGHNAQVKLSHQDKRMMNFIINILNEGSPNSVSIVEKLSDFDAVIATGSGNSSRYFDYYFSKVPNIIRKNRTSIAVLEGNESERELQLLGRDVFSYFGLGCRNVTSVLLPEGYSLETLALAWQPFADIINHHKYANNYDYNKSILLVNKEEHFDFGFLLLKETEEIFSPISVLNFYFYKDQKEIDNFMDTHNESLQCVVGKDVDFGMAQNPELWDYADGVDTMKFLESI